MSAAIDDRFDTRGFFSLAHRWATEVTCNLVRHERQDTIAQTPEAMAVLRAVAGEPTKAGGNGHVFHFPDNSAVVTTNVWPDKVWQRWVA